MDIDNDQYSRLHPDVEFENGVLKIQKGAEDELTDQEIEACEILRINLNEGDDDNNDEDNDDSDNNDSDEDGGRIMSEVHRRKALRNGNSDNESDYGNINFIYCSAAEVERLWSLAKHILTDERKGMMDADNFEALLYLKVNCLYWNAMDVAEADRERARKEAESRRGSESED